MAMSNSSTDYDSDMETEIEALHYPDGREFDVKSLLQHVKDIILFTNEKEEEPVTSKEAPPLTWCKSLLVPLEKLMRDISERDERSVVATSILKELLPYAWGAKAVLVLTSFAMNHGLWMLAQMYSASPPSLKKVKDNNKLYSVLSRVLSKGSELDSYCFYLSLILSFSKRPKENRLPKPALTSLFQAIVRVVECIIELQDLPSEDLQGNVIELEDHLQGIAMGYKKTMANIPIIVHHVITMVIYCATVINQFPNNDYEISEAEDNKLYVYASHINELVKDLSKHIKDCNQFLEETKYDKEYQIPICKTSSMDNREALEYLIKSGDDPKLQNAADTIISQLKGKHVMLLVSDEDSSMEEIRILDKIYSQRGMKEQFSILWIPLYSSIGKERAAQHCETRRSYMNWYEVPHPAMVSKEATEFIKNKWRFQSKSNILAMLDPQGTVLNINAFHMLWIWGSLGFPFTRSRERALWKTVTFNMEFILDGIDPIPFKWMRGDKYIFLYGGDDIEWVRKFTTSAKRVSQKFNIPVELLYVGKPNKGVHQRTTKKIKDTMTNEGLSHVLILDDMMAWLFWIRLRSMLISKMSHQNRQESEDWMTRQLKWILGYETERSWALLAKGKAVVTHGPGSTILQTLMEYDTKNVSEYQRNSRLAEGNQVRTPGQTSKELWQAVGEGGLRLVGDEMVTRGARSSAISQAQREYHRKRMLAKGKAVHGPGSTISQALMEYDTKNVSEYERNSRLPGQTSKEFWQAVGEGGLWLVGDEMVTRGARSSAISQALMEYDTKNVSEYERNSRLPGQTSKEFWQAVGEGGLWLVGDEMVTRGARSSAISQAPMEYDTKNVSKYERNSRLPGQTSKEFWQAVGEGGLWLVGDEMVTRGARSSAISQALMEYDTKNVSEYQRNSRLAEGNQVRTPGQTSKEFWQAAGEGSLQLVGDEMVTRGARSSAISQAQREYHRKCMLAKGNQVGTRWASISPISLAVDEEGELAKRKAKVHVERKSAISQDLKARGERRSAILRAMKEYDTQNVGGSFEDEFKKLHEKVVSSGRPFCCQVEFPVWSSGMPETMRCPQPNCKTEIMDKSIVFECCHHKPLPEK